MDKKTVNKILSETETGYDLVSEKFSQTRKHFWRGLEGISGYAKEGDNVLDFGCGNGRLLEIFAGKNIGYFGLDVSQKLLDLAKNRYFGESASFLKIDPRQATLPFSDNFFNATYSIAVFHHFPKEHAGKIARELYRVTAPDGHIIITVWNLWQKKYFMNIIKNWLLKIVGRSELGWNDCQISFQDNQGKIFWRYHHAFTPRELKSIFKDAGFTLEKCQGADNRNILLIGRKIYTEK
jgi:ubiquinone/menaquinone biosynthesis C-methylase UbiE